jgi:hypothetical protein
MADDPGMTRTGERIKQLTDEAEGADAIDDVLGS